VVTQKGCGFVPTARKVHHHQGLHNKGGPTLFPGEFPQDCVFKETYPTFFLLIFWLFFPWPGKRSLGDFGMPPLSFFLGGTTLHNLVMGKLVLTPPPQRGPFHMFFFPHVGASVGGTFMFFDVGPPQTFLVVLVGRWCGGHTSPHFFSPLFFVFLTLPFPTGSLQFYVVARPFLVLLIFFPKPPKPITQPQSPGICLLCVVWKWLVSFPPSAGAFDPQNRPLPLFTFTNDFLFLRGHGKKKTLGLFSVQLKLGKSGGGRTFLPLDTGGGRLG